MEDKILEQIDLYLRVEKSEELNRVVSEYADEMKYRWDTYLAGVIADSKYNDSQKAKLLLLFNLEDSKTIIIKSFSDDNNKKIELEKIKDGHYKADIISTMKDETLKIELMKTLPNDQHIAVVINSIKDEKEKIKQIKTYAKKMPQFYALLSNVSYKELKKALNIPKMQPIGLPEDMSIGFELEMELKEGVCANTRAFIFKQGKLITDWRVKEDTSLFPNRGMELNSSILQDTPEDWEKVSCICEIMKRNNFEVNGRTSAQISIGADYLKTLDEWKNLYRIWRVSEDIFYRISNPEGELIRRSSRTFAKKLNPKFEEAERDGTIQIDSVKDVDEFIEQLQNATKTSQGIKDKEYGLNLLDVNNEDKNRVEIRIPNGTLDPKIISETTKLYGNLFKVSKQIVTDANKRKKFEKLISNKFDSEEDKMLALLDLLFDNEEDKNIFSNRWKSIEKQKTVFDERGNELS